MVTGADDGIGRATALGLARLAATVVIGVATLTEAAPRKNRSDPKAAIMLSN